MQSRFSYRPEQIDATAMIAPGVVILGDVTVGAESSVWFGSVLRGDTEAIIVGRRSNIQELCVLHADPGFPCTLGDEVIVGHGAIVHGATVEDRVMIGMRAVLLNGAKIGRNSIVAAGALVPEGAEIPPGTLVMGVPAKAVRATTAADIERIAHAAEHYVASARQFRDEQQAG